MCLKNTDGYPTFFPEDLTPPKLLPLYFGELTDMVTLTMHSADEVQPAYSATWRVTNLESTEMTIELQIDRPLEIGLSDYIVVTLDFSTFDQSWKYYSSGLITTETKQAKSVLVSLHSFNLGTSALFFTLREISRVLSLVVFSYVIVCTVARLFAGVSAFNAFVMMGNLQVLVHMPLLGLEFPKLAGEIMKPLIAVAKLDLLRIANNKLPKDFQPGLPSEFTHYATLSRHANHHAELYLDALYGSSLSVESTQGIMVLFLIAGAVMVVIVVFDRFSKIKATEWLLLRLRRIFVLNFPLRLVMQAWLFLLISAILNFWTTPKLSNL